MSSEQFDGNYYFNLKTNMKKIALLALMAMMLGGCGTIVVDEEVVIDEVAEEISVYCTQEPTFNDAGAPIYLIDEKYGDLNHLGQLFTAAGCEGRVEEVWGDTYDLGSIIWLKDVPSAEFLEVLLAVGYVCDENTDSDATCSTWKLEGEVPVETILTIEGFADEIKMDDCVDCG